MSPPLLEPSLREAYARCEEIARRRIENFPVISDQLPKDAVPHFAAVYAYCRRADDAGDESESTAAALAALDAIESELRAALAGDARSPEMAALAATAREKRLPERAFLDLLAAFRQDQTKTRYATWGELLDYCTRSANPVGRLVLGVLDELGGARDDEKLRLSNSICTGLQLANFWQDVARDLAKGRIYAPLDVLARHGVGEAQLREGRCDAAFRACMEELCDRTAPFFADGARLADLIAKRFRVPILAFAIAGEDLLGRIRAAGFDVFARRPEIAKRHTKRVVARAVAARWIPAFRPKA